MAKHDKNIPLNLMDDDFSQGIAIDKIRIKKSDFKTATEIAGATQPHRDEGHAFHIVEKGSVLIEIDFQQYLISAPAVVYMHPNQVHRILDIKDMTICYLAIKDERLHPEYPALLDDLTPAKPLILSPENQKPIAEAFALCLHFSKQKNAPLYQLLLKDACNTFVACIISTFLKQTRAPGKLSRPEQITRQFQRLLAHNYRSLKRPGDYAQQLHITTHYLNNSVKAATGLPVSQHIQDRIILEAKRLLYHTDKSVKEIAFALGYDDYPYFSRLFTKAAGMSALTFRNKKYD